MYTCIHTYIHTCTLLLTSNNNSIYVGSADIGSPGKRPAQRRTSQGGRLTELLRG